ncbi:hypothetical protein LWI29_008296 [Acer saccharum]|uniref:Uncharacterized protein n=1 Tax=Acer saccharum TaxID=4024 RepID=A0AA39V7X7_ACESA|nr:hypothetical protein LWI29_008296 [Acer saccharum]
MNTIARRRLDRQTIIVGNLEWKGLLPPACALSGDPHHRDFFRRRFSNSRLPYNVAGHPPRSEISDPCLFCSATRVALFDPTRPDRFSFNSDPRRFFFTGDSSSPLPDHRASPTFSRLRQTRPVGLL